MSEIYSMTGYGSAKGEVSGLLVSVELKSVNNRYLDCSVRLPRNLLFAEESVKRAVSEKAARGKIDVFVNVDTTSGGSTVVKADTALAEGYYEAIKQLSKEFDLKKGVTAYELSRFPDVLSVETKEIDRDTAGEQLYALTIAAMEEFNTMRLREGERMKADILEKAANIEQMVEVLEQRSAESVNEYRAKLEAKLRELLEDRSVEETPLITEAALCADRTAVDEETVRLRSHISQLRALLEEGSPAGRKLDFLLQEFNREANTIGSKCSDAAMASRVVDLKSEIEKIREQIQNIE